MNKSYVYSGQPITTMMINALPANTESLLFSDCQFPQQDTIQRICRLNNLQHLSITKCNIKNRDVLEIMENRQPALRAIHLDQNEQVSRCVIHQVMKNMPKDVDISIFSPKIDQIWFKDLRSLPVPFILKNLPNLNKITLTDVILATAGVKALARGLHQLTSVSLVGCLINDQSLFEMAINLPNLFDLNLSQNILTDEALNLISRHLTKLEMLWIDRNLIDNINYSKFVMQMGKLKVLQLGGVTLRSLEIIGDCLKTISNLTLSPIGSRRVNYDKFNKHEKWDIRARMPKTWITFKKQYMIA